MGAHSFGTTPLKGNKNNNNNNNKKKKTGISSIPRVYKKRHTWYSSVILNGRSILWKMENAGQLKGMLITVLQLDQLCRKQGKWVEAPYILLFISLWDMPDLRPKGTDLGVKPPAPSSSLTLCLYLGAPNWKGLESGHLSRSSCLSFGRNSNSPISGRDYLEDSKSA